MPRVGPFDSAEYLDSPEMIAAYLAEALETGDPSAVSMAVEAAARASAKQNEVP